MTYSAGKGGKALLLISGGPGLPSNFNQFRDYHQIYVDHRFRVVTWDQLGCGESDAPVDDSLWTLERFVQETERVRDALNLGKVYLLGHSWGGIVGLEYSFAYPQWVNSFVLASCATSIPEVQRSCDQLKAKFGEPTNEVEHQEIVQKLLHQHICRLPVWPQASGPSAEKDNPRVREIISGLEFWKWTGPLKNWNRLPDLHQLSVPVLIIQGEYDFVTPALSQKAYEKLPNAELKILKNCSHLPYYEDAHAYTTAVLSFLKKSAI